MAAFASRDLIHFVQEHDAAAFHAFDRDPRHLVHVDQFLFFFLDQKFDRFAHSHLALLGTTREQPGEHVLQVDVHVLHAGRSRDFERRAFDGDFDFHDSVVDLAGTKLVAELFASPLSSFGRLFLLGHQEVEQALFGVLLGTLGDFIQALVANHVDRRFHQIADDRFYIAAHITDFGELAGFHLKKRRVGELGQTACQLSLADAGRSNHEDVLGHHILGHFGIELLTANAIAQRYRYGAFRFWLPNDVLVEFFDDLPGRELIEYRRIFIRLRGEVNNHLGKLLEDEILVGVDTGPARDVHRLFDNLSCG